MAGRTKDPLQAWEHAGSREIELPSGAGKATVRTLDLIDGVVLGSIPNPLRAIALKAEAGDFNPADAGDEELRDWVELKAHVVALVTEKYNGKAIQLTPEWVRDSLHKGDRDRIFAVATHVLLPKQAEGMVAMQSFREGLAELLAAQNSDGNGKGAE